MASNDVRRSGDDKGVFDHLAEYLLQQPRPGAEAVSPAIPIDEAPPQTPGGQAPAEVPPQEPPPSAAGEPEIRAQELVFAETAEQLVVEKEVVVREEVVLSKRIQERVQSIDDQLRRTEVEVERISPEEAARIADGNGPKVEAPPPPVPENKPVPPVQQQQEARIARGSGSEVQTPRPSAAQEPPSRLQQQTPRSSSHSKAWWAWFALILCAAVLTAFALGQFLGSAG